MKKIKITWVSLLLIITFSGCAHSVFIRSTPGALTPATSMPEIHFRPTDSQVVSDIKYLCPLTSSSEIPDIEGEFLLTPINREESPYLLNWETGEKTYFINSENMYFSNFTVSPNRHWIAYFATQKQDYTFDSRILVVADLNGKIVYQQAMPQEWYSLDSWLNDDTLMLERRQTDPDNNMLDSPLPVTLIDPFTGESNDLDNSHLPHLTPSLWPLIHWDLFGKSGTAYDPTLNLVAYAKILSGQQSISLWNIEAGREIASVQAPIDFTVGPIWTIDGTQFATVSPIKSIDSTEWAEGGRLSEEIFSVSRNGEITRLTYLTDEFLEVDINGYAWSPDGRFLSFNMVTRPEINQSGWTADQHIAVLDVQTKRVKIFCIQSYPEATKIFWSPNGQQILIASVSFHKDSNNRASYGTVLVDLKSNRVFNVADGLIPGGWVVRP